MRSLFRCFSSLLISVGIALLGSPVSGQQVDLHAPRSTAADEDFLFIPPGFDKPGVPKQAVAAQSGTLKIRVVQARTGKPTFCRINVIGSDGQYYQPAQNYLTKYNMVGAWPKTGWGNRVGKAPFRYLGHYFYSWGEATVPVPPGKVRIEVWKGLEYRPVTREVQVASGETAEIALSLQQTLSLPEEHYFSGDSHLHFDRRTDVDEQTIFDLLEAEDIHYGMVLAYNEPAGPYHGLMSTMASPQDRGLGRKSTLNRGSYAITSGQEYRSGTYGHLNLYQRDGLVLPGEHRDANNWPLYGSLARETLRNGGYAWYAHGGYAQALYADFVQGNLSAVELLQFGFYRGIALEDWYRILNIGYRLPIIGASDFPACRKMGDCLTYVRLDKSRDMSDWLSGASQGKSFVTTAPALLLDVEGLQPGAELTLDRPRVVQVRVSVASEVAPVTDLQLIVNGEVVQRSKISAQATVGKWSEFHYNVSLDRSAWIAARAFSTTRRNLPDAEAHTNPVYVTLHGRAPYQREALDSLLAKLDRQIDLHRQRQFNEKAQVLTYFERSRDILLKIREAGGFLASEKPWLKWEDSAKAGFDPGRRDQSEQELREFLKPVPPRSSIDAMQAIEVRPGFHLEPVAQEPEIVDPVAAAFDEDGNLYVAELRDYPYLPKAGATPLGTVRLLRDTDRDGRFDRSTVFADKLLWAAGIAPWKGGVFITAPPNIWYMKDTDGDGIADVRRLVFTGFGTENQQAMLNNLQFGLDHQVYGATAHNGGLVRHADRPQETPLSLKGHDFRFDPITERLESITGTIQFGNTFDDWGHRFVCSQGTALMQIILPEQYLKRNPALTVTDGIFTISPQNTPIFRISQVERWRAIRSARRVAFSERNPVGVGVSHHVLDAGAGVTIYRGGAYPPEYYGDAFIGDAQNNLVHRMKMHRKGITFEYQRMEQGTEFARSADNWFRPVNFVNAPDGTLYVLDMSREIIESIHIPSDVVKFLDLKNGRQHGRIYRLAPDGFRSTPPPQLSRATTEELVRHLESPHGWWRDTAHRLLFERQDPSAIPLLRQRLEQSSQPQARLHALWSLEGLRGLTADDLRGRLRDSHPALRIHALQLAERVCRSHPDLQSQMLALADDPDVEVRFQLAFSLGEIPHPDVPRVLLKLLQTPGNDSWMRSALLSSITPHALSLSATLLKDPAAIKPDQRPVLDQLALVISLQSSSDLHGAYLSQLAALDQHPRGRSLAGALLLGFGNGLKQRQQTLPVSFASNAGITKFLSQSIERARTSALDPQQTDETRIAGLRLIGCLYYEAAHSTLSGLLTPDSPPTIQTTVLQLFGGYSQPEIAEIILNTWRGLTPDLRREALRTLLSRDPWIQRWLTAVQEDPAMLSQLDVSQREFLTHHPHPPIREQATRVLAGTGLGNRQEVITKYEPVLKEVGDAQRGSAIFSRECSGCHKIGNVGVATGPNLASSASREPAALLTNILDPNRAIQPEFVQYIVIEKSGRITQGMIASQSANNLTLKREKDATETILRSNIEELVSTGKSLMPEGLEQKLTLPEMADLIAFLQQAQATQPPAPAPLERGTLPGLIEP